MGNIRDFKSFITESANVEQAYEIINEKIDSFVSNSEATDKDADELNRVQSDVLSKYDLPQSDVENIKSRIADAISKKLGNYNEEE